MASSPYVFNFVLERETALVLPGKSRNLEIGSDLAVDREHATNRLVRLDAAGRQLVESHIQPLTARHRHQGRGAA